MRPRSASRTDARKATTRVTCCRTERYAGIMTRCPLLLAAISLLATSCCCDDDEASDVATPATTTVRATPTPPPTPPPTPAAESPTAQPAEPTPPAVAKVPAADEGVPGQTFRVRFDRGSSGATLKGAVLRGERNRYLLGASKGQLMKVNVTATEDNAAFSIRAPNGANHPWHRRGTRAEAAGKAGSPKTATRSSSSALPAATQPTRSGSRSTAD